MGDGNVSGTETGSVGRIIRNIPMEISIAEASAMFPGFRFSPTDEELIKFYLKKKIEGSDKDVEVIPEVDICRHEPWDLPAQSVIQSDNEWFFFNSRGKKYPNGSQSKRATKCGYWKATGKERLVKASGSNVIGTKRTLVFHAGRAPKGQRTEWIMHEFCTSEKSQDAMVVCRLRKNSEFHLNDSTRKNSHNQEDHHAPALFGGELSGMMDGNKFADGDGYGNKFAEGDGYPKECSSSYNSHSVEQSDGYYSESDDIPANNFFQHDSSSQQQGYAEEDDCYADIMKDDIIKLDDSTSDRFKLHMSKSDQTAHNKRIRLRKHKVKLHLPERLEAVCKLGENKNSPQDASFFVDHLKLSWRNLPFPFVSLVLMIVLVLCVVFGSETLALNTA